MKTGEMTMKEFMAFAKDKKYVIGYPPKDSVVIYSEFQPYHDVTYSYCERTDTVYEERFYIGD